ncbi:MAG: hypothetical protein A3J76_03800 [Candidatus Moranbacteria bacterium RBG_13_45_13]|nr:MAG: hypothetical protein A3J76_03800 [Candidatus Moranbacteria bacterium RBG_13_45_13]
MEEVTKTTSDKPLTLIDCGGGHKIIVNTNPYRGVAAVTAAILDSAGEDPDVLGNDLHWGHLLKHQQLLGKKLEMIEWGKQTLAKEIVLRAKWPAGTAGVHLREIKSPDPDNKKKVHCIILTKVTSPSSDTPLWGRMELGRVRRIVELANAHLRVFNGLGRAS